MAYYGQYDSYQESNERIYEYPPNSGYAQQRPLARSPCQYATQGGGYGDGRPPSPPYPYPGPQGQIVRVYCKANPDYALAISDGRVVMLYYNPNDPTMQWVKVESWSNRVRDQVGHPAFALVNKATGQALRHAPGEGQEVLLTQYEGDSTYDENILWSESEDMGYGYRTVRKANDIRLNLDAFQGDRRSGGMKDGTRVVLWKWNKQDNQLWKLSPCY